MESRNFHRTLAAIAAAATLLAALPLASALSAGVDARGIADVKAAGASPAYGQVWAGHWLESSGWSGFDAELKIARDAGTTPVTLSYYWGDSISVSCVQNGCDGRTKSSWDAYTRTLASHIKSVMGGKTAYVVMEPEFNKNGIQSWETFDGYLAAQASTLRANAPGTKIVIGFGSWANDFSTFDRAIGASDMVGFQYMRASTRNAAAETSACANSILTTTKTMRALGKPVILFDLAIGTYGGWNGVQESCLRGIRDRAGELQGAGLQGVIWRYTRDNSRSSGYFGAAESTWGAKTSSGAAKPGWDELVSIVKGGGAAAKPPSSSPPPTSSPTSPSGSVFTNVKGNEWWIETSVSGSATSVTASVNGATPVALTKQSWGAWAKSIHAASGSSVRLTAKLSDGSTKSADFTWPPGSAPKPAPTSTPTTSSSFTATFSGVKGNDYWEQVDVQATNLKGVNVRLNGGAWKPMTHASWGSWTLSTFAPSGTKVQFQAVSTSGATALSATYTWPVG